jgi:hypothetical protein
MASLRPLLAALAERMEGVLRLHLACRFDDGREQDGVIDFVAPAHQVERLQAAVTQQLCAQPWRAPLAVVRWTLLASGEVAVAQLRLFADPDADAASPGDLVGTLAARYGAVFFRAQRHNAGHPVAERRGQFVGLAQQAPVGHVPALA